jgi:uncharacterized integral membrane protein
MVKIIIAVILLVIVVLFVLQNTEVVEAQLLVWTVSMSRALMLLGTFLIGIIAGLLMRRPRRRE